MRQTSNESRKKMVHDHKPDRHPTSSELYQFLVEGEQAQNRTEILDHLSECTFCFQEITKMIDARKEADFFDIALPKTAATSIDGVPIPFEGGKGIVVIRPYVEERDKGIITIEIKSTSKEQFEGKEVVLRDGKGEVLLKGKVIDGEVSQKVEAIKDIDENDFTMFLAEKG